MLRLINYALLSDCLLAGCLTSVAVPEHALHLNIGCIWQLTATALFSPAPLFPASITTFSTSDVVVVVFIFCSLLRVCPAVWYLCRWAFSVWVYTERGERMKKKRQPNDIVFVVAVALLLMPYEHGPSAMAFYIPFCCWI